MKTILRIGLFASALFLVEQALAQRDRSYIRSGNDWYQKILSDSLQKDTSSLKRAEDYFLQALEEKEDSYQALFNLGNTYFQGGRRSIQKKLTPQVKENLKRKLEQILQQKALEWQQQGLTQEEMKERMEEIFQKELQGGEENISSSFEAARARYEQMKRVSDLPDSLYAHADYAIGNSYMMEKKYDEALKHYKAALRKKPNDLALKYNYMVAKKEKEKQDKNNKNNKDNKNNKNNKNSQDNKNDKDKQKNKNPNDNKKEKDKQGNKQNQQEKKKPSQAKFSKQNAERLLNAMKDDEKKVKAKVLKAQQAKDKKISTKNW